MEDHSAGHISTQEAASIIQSLQESLGAEDVNFHCGVGYRHLMTIAADLHVKTTPPHDILGKPISNHLPAGKGSERLREIMERGRTVMGESEINAVRRDLGENPATEIWLWGEGTTPTLTPFADRFDVRCAVITAVDLLRGLSKLIGWDVLEVPGATGLVETNYTGKAAAAVKALDEYDLVLVHIEGTDEAGHAADVKSKILGLERIDQHIVAPVLQRLKDEGQDWRILILPDHPTPCHLRTHTSAPVPFAIAGKGVKAVTSGPFCESTAEQSDLHIPRGSNLMEYFLTVR